MTDRICKKCEYFEDWYGWPRGDCYHPTNEVYVEVDAHGTCEHFKPSGAIPGSVCKSCNNTGWLDPIDGWSDGSFTESDNPNSYCGKMK